MEAAAAPRASVAFSTTPPSKDQVTGNCPQIKDKLTTNMMFPRKTNVRLGATTLALLTSAAALHQTHAATLSVNLIDDPLALAQSILGTGITIVGVPTLTSQPGQTGTFTDFTSGSPTPFTLGTGVLLTTGIASGAEGDFIGGPSFDAGGAGNAQLSALAGNPTFDAVVLTIQFMSTNVTAMLNFAFASASYPNDIGTSFSDPVAIYFNGTNVALVPGTGTPVSIDSINAGTNPGLYTQDSDGSTPFNYGGVTRILTATGTVSTSGVNTLQISIADAGDGSVDSAVLLQGGSFTSVPEPGIAALLAFGSLALVGQRRRQISPSSQDPASR